MHCSQAFERDRWDTERNSSPSLPSPALCLAASSLPSAAASADFPPSPAEPEGRERQSVGWLTQKRKAFRTLCGVQCKRRKLIDVNLKLHSSWRTDNTLRLNQVTRDHNQENKEMEKTSKNTEDTNIHRREKRVTVKREIVIIFLGVKRLITKQSQ